MKKAAVWIAVDLSASCVFAHKSIGIFLTAAE